jgi:hypothetical protein
MIELIHSGVENIVCIQPFGCLPNHVVGKGVIKHIRSIYPMANIAAIYYDPGAREVNQLNRIKLLLATAGKNAARKAAAEDDPYYGAGSCSGSSLETASGSGSGSKSGSGKKRSGSSGKTKKTPSKKASKNKRRLFPF